MRLIHAFRLHGQPSKPQELCDYAAVILEDPEKYRGMTIPVSSGYIAQPDCEKVLSKVTGKTIRYGT